MSLPWLPARSTIIRCVSIKCQQFQLVSAILPSQDDYIHCKFCERRQPASAYIDPVSKHAMRGYNVARLRERLEQLKERASPGVKRITAALEAGMHARTKNTGRNVMAQLYAAADVPSSADSIAQCSVPQGVQPGDALTLQVIRGKPKSTLRVIVESVDELPMAKPMQRNPGFTESNVNLATFKPPSHPR